MTNPRHYLFLTILYLMVVAGVCAFLFVPLKTAFMANWGFNLLIFLTFCVGIGINIYQILRLEPEIKWIKIFRTGDPGLSITVPPVLLNTLAKHLEEIHRDRFRLSALSLGTVLDGIRGHLDESREISKYMIGLLVFLGLLGTFWGLLHTIDTVGQVISGTATPLAGSRALHNQRYQCSQAESRSHVSHVVCKDDDDIRLVGGKGMNGENSLKNK